MLGRALPIERARKGARVPGRVRRGVGRGVRGPPRKPDLEAGDDRVANCSPGPWSPRQTRSLGRDVARARGFDGGDLRAQRGDEIPLGRGHREPIRPTSRSPGNA